MSRQKDSGYFVRLGAITGLDRTVRDLGGDAEALLAQHGLSPEMMAEDDRLVTMGQVLALLESAAEAVDCPHFSLELASRQDENLLGTMGLLLQTADTLRQALLDVQNYVGATHASHIHWTLVGREEYESFEVSAELQEISPRQSRLLYELCVAQCYQVVRSVGAAQAEIAAVCFRHGGAVERAAMSRYFKVPVQVGADFNGLLFVPGALNRKIAKADTRVHEILRRFIADQQVPLSVDSLAEQVKVLIRPLLPTGHCTIDRIARCFNCDKRTLQRSLREECDTTYRELLDEVRFESACFYLRQSNLSITHLAQLAGFTETTNFSRAFHRRLGMSPRQWRQQHGARPSRRLLRGMATRPSA